jgi:flagellar hook-basal body complex protein FliE
MKATTGQALAAYAAAVTHGRPTPPPAETETGGEPSFGALLRQELASAADSLARGEATAVKGLLGEASIQEVVEAVSAAELSLQKVTAIRDRVIAAYQEIVRMPV